MIVLNEDQPPEPADPWEREPLPAEYDDDPIDLVECESPEAAVEMFNRTVEWVNDEACALWEEANSESSE